MWDRVKEGHLSKKAATTVQKFVPNRKIPIIQYVTLDDATDRLSVQKMVRNPKLHTEAVPLRKS